MHNSDTIFFQRVMAEDKADPTLYGFTDWLIYSFGP
jgi:hypothetical protein